MKIGDVGLRQRVQQAHHTVHHLGKIKIDIRICQTGWSAGIGFFQASRLDFIAALGDKIINNGHEERTMSFLALKEELVHAFHAVNGVTPKNAIIKCLSRKGKPVNRLMNIEMFLKLVEQHIDECVLGKGVLAIDPIQQSKQILGLYLRGNQAAQVDSAMGPGIDAGNKGGRAGSGEVASGMVVAKNGLAVSKTFQVWGCLAMIAIQGKVRCR